MGRTIGLLVLTFLLGYFNSFSQTDTSTDSIPVLEDKEVKIKGIFIIGNEKTQNRIIRRELNFKEGDILRRSELDLIVKQDRNKIFNLALFNTVNIEILESSETEVDILIKVDERWYVWPSPIFRLVDMNFNDWWVNRNRDLSRVHYGFNIQHFNFGGRNEKLRINARFGFTRIFDVTYIIPNLDKSQNHGISIGLQYNERKNIAYNTIDHFRLYYDSSKILRRKFSPNITYRYRDGFFNSHSFIVDFNQTVYADTINQLNERYFTSSRTEQTYFRLGYGFARDTRDYRSYPLKGEFYSLAVYKLGLGFFDSGMDQWISLMRLQKYMDLNKGWYLGSSTITMLSSKKNQSYVNYLTMGFDNVLVRGFELDLIETPNFIIHKNSLRKRIVKGHYDFGKYVPLKQFRKLPYAVYGKVFYDHGFADRYPNYDGSNRLTRSYLYGFGAGLDIIGSYDMVIRLESSFNSEGELNFFLNFKADI